MNNNKPTKQNRMNDMKNADMPAMPLVDSGFGQYKPEVFGGLTKREMIAMNLMNGILSNQGYSYNGFSDAAKMSIEAADALLAELDK